MQLKPFTAYFVFDFSGACIFCVCRIFYLKMLLKWKLLTKHATVGQTRPNYKKQIFITLALYPLGCHMWAVPTSVALRQGPHFKVAAMASCWQRARDLIGSGFESLTFRTRGRDLPLVPSGRLRPKYDCYY